MVRRRKGEEYVDNERGTFSSSLLSLLLLVVLAAATVVVLEAAAVEYTWPDLGMFCTPTCKMYWSHLPLQSLILRNVKSENLCEIFVNRNNYHNFYCYFYCLQMH